MSRLVGETTWGSSKPFKSYLKKKRESVGAAKETLVTCSTLHCSCQLKYDFAELKAENLYEWTMRQTLDTDNNHSDPF